MPNLIDSPVKIIAEIGVNHNGNLQNALDAVVEAKKCGADIVKFQAFRAELNLLKNAPMADYQIKNTKKTTSQLEMLRELELTEEDFKAISDLCEVLNIEFMATAFDLPSLKMLMKLGVKRLKVPSGEIDNVPLLIEISKAKLPVIVSTGMSEADDIEFAVMMLEQHGCFDITLLQCTSQYPCPVEFVNLASIDFLARKFNKCAGLSDHTTSEDIPAFSVYCGACIIEKHFTLDNSLPGPDHEASLNPNAFSRMVKNVRAAEAIYGHKGKMVLNVEQNTKKVARKSIVASCNIKKGDIFTFDNLTMKRPSGGLSGKKWPDIIGTVSNKDYSADEQILL